VSQFVIALTVLVAPLPAALAADVQPTRDGSVDVTFADGGGVWAHVEGYIGTREQSAARAVVAQPDGKIVEVGDTGTDGQPFDNYMHAVRLNADGSRDVSFNAFDPPSLLHDPGFGTFYILPAGYNLGSQFARAVGLQHDGSIVIAGYAEDLDHNAYPRALLARLTPDGFLDTTFRGGGGNLRYVDTFFTALTVLPDDSIVAAGIGTPEGRADSDFYVAHFGSDGGLIDDTYVDFAGGQGNNDGAFGLAVQGDRVIVVGRASAQYHAQDCAVAALSLRNNLQPDASFGFGGKLTIDLAPPTYASSEDLSGNVGFTTPDSVDVCRSVAIGNNGMITLGGDAAWDGQISFTSAFCILNDCNDPTTQDFKFHHRSWVIARLNADGSRDETFGDSGFSGVVTSDDHFSEYSQDTAVGRVCTTSQAYCTSTLEFLVPSIALQPGSAACAGLDDVVFGLSHLEVHSYATARVGRLDCHGARDQSFGTDSATAALGLLPAGAGIAVLGSDAPAIRATGAPRASVAAMTLSGNRPVAVGTLSGYSYGDTTRTDLFFFRLANDRVFSTLGD